MFHQIIIFLIIFAYSCVGTIEENNPAVQTSKIAPTNTNMEFDGIESASAISHSKVEVTFKSVIGGSGTFTYMVFLNGNYGDIVAAEDSTNLTIDGQGYYKMVVSGLSKGTTYSFSVRVYDQETDLTDENIIKKQATTLSTEVPDFSGVYSVTNLAGIDGLTKLLVTWLPATAASSSSSTFLGSDPNAISGYNIYVGTTESNLELHGTVAGKNSTTYTITELTQGTKYYVRVRAKNSKTPAVEESNNIIKSKLTLAPTPISFSGLTSATVPTNATGFATINLTWPEGTGNFDRYKIFTSTTLKTAFDPLTDTPAVSNVGLSTTSYSLSVASPNTTYYVAVVACLGESCTDYRGHNNVLTAETTPPVALFNGISGMTIPSDVTGLTSLSLTWSAPDTSYGVYDTIKIFKASSTGSYNAATDLIAKCPTAAGVPCYSTVSSTGATIQSLSTGTEYCFVAKAFTTTPAHPLYPSGRTHTNEVLKCGTPTYSTPGFLGINPGCEATTTSSFRVRWTHPTNPVGIYNSYEVFYKAGNSGFSFDTATSSVYDDDGNKCDSDTGYCRIEVSKDFAYQTISSLISDTNYMVGVRTYFVNGSQVYRDSNPVVINCPTDRQKAVHNGWDAAYAIGPKTNGLYPGYVIREKLIEPEETYSNWVNHPPIPKEDVNGDDDSSSINGIVYLIWDDFSFSTGTETLYDLRNGPGVGYNIYRMEHQTLFETNPPSTSHSGWGSPLNSTLIAPKIVTNSATGQPYRYGSYVDYNHEHPLSSSGSKTEGKIYWYKVVAVINDNEIAFDEEQVDAKIKVILPPANMALGHRWIMNKEMCGILNRTIDRENGYRCPYNGIGTNGGYLDYGNHFVINRFQMGFRFTRGNETGSCYADPAGTFYNDPTLFYGATTVASEGRIAGDCIGHFNANTGASGMRASKAYSPYLAGWEGAAYYATANNSAFNTNLYYLDNGIGTLANSNLWDNDALHPNGKGAHRWFSNEAYLNPYFQTNPKMLAWVTFPPNPNPA